MADETIDAAKTEYAGQSTPGKLVEIARYFLFIGIVGFGGPMVHIAMMEDDLVGEDSKEWTDQSIFMEGLAICNMLPGPASTQLGIFMGWIYAGVKGALVAGFFFMLPTFIIVLFFSWLYFAYQQVPAVEALFYGINPVVIGLIVGACYSLTHSAFAEGRTDAKVEIGDDTWNIDYLLVVLLLVTTIAMAVLGTNPVLLFIVAGLIGVTAYRSEWIRTNARRLTPWTIAGTIAAAVYVLRDRVLGLLGPAVVQAVQASPLWGVLVALWANPWIQLFLFMIYTGSFIYGGGLVLIPFIELYVVREFGWMTGREFVDGIAIGQLSPGPVVMTTAFVGYKLMLDISGGIIAIAVLGALVATIGAFSPSFAFIIGFFPYFAKIRENEVVQSALIAVNAAVIGAILGATVLLAQESFVVEQPSIPVAISDITFDVFTILLAVATYWLFVRGIHAAYLIIGGGAVGIGAFFLV
ncbi:chromate efflux transporter [Natronolimnohabitans innermongolicus]|uniref:Chromate transport protein n=1 Tax=Natronolimnohabitans innermongolicus JCM 12255 TaxID=1227499 RepID=L9WL18_9EURY|nr:chromate efflux transporter [Natronolimnohabitans innermongolicus]ELY50159.1 chromate transport protein [Natronolimnohabitans innermongolicus JCM 12255]